MLNKIKIAIYYLGWFGIGHCIFCKIYLKFLRKSFDFNKWHSTSPIQCRYYKKKLVEYISSLDIQKVTEIGCGLAEVAKKTSKIRSDITFYCYDNDSNVIKAASYLNKNNKKINLSVGSFKHPFEESDVIVLINFTHWIEINTLFKDIKILTNKINARYLIIDFIEKGIVTNRKERFSNFKKEFELLNYYQNIQDRDIGIFKLS